MYTLNLSFNGQKVFIGIDVHVRTWAISCVIDGVVAKKFCIEPSVESFLRTIKRLFRGAEFYSAYEAGYSGFWLHRELELGGVRNIVVNPSSIEVASRDRVKTDRRDSEKIATQLAAGRLKGIRIPSEAEEQRRLLSRTREQLVRNRSRVMNQVRMKLHQFGLLGSEPMSISVAAMEKFLSGDVKMELKIVLTSLVEVWRTLNAKIASLNRELSTQAQVDPLERVYRSIPGFGPYSARVISNELGDMSQFGNEDQLFSFTGLTPQEFTSGDNRRLGHISRQGSARLRHMLVEAAWRAIKKDPGLRNDFDRIAARAGKKRAIVAIARKLIGRARALFRKNELYKIQLAA